MSEKSFDELCEEISAQVGSPTLLVGDKLKPVLNQHFFARFVAANTDSCLKNHKSLLYYLYVQPKQLEILLWHAQKRC